MITPSASIALGFAFVLLGGINVWLVLEAWSRVKTANVSSRMLALHRIGGYLFIALFCVMTYYMLGPAGEWRRQLGHGDPPYGIGDDPVAAAVYQGPRRPLLQESAQSADAARAYDLRSFLRSDRQYRRALPDSSIKDRARVDQFGHPIPGDHDRYESSQRSDAETVLKMPQPGPCCRRTEGRSGMAGDCQSYAHDPRRGHIRDGCPDDRWLPGGAESFPRFRNRGADGSGAGACGSALRALPHSGSRI
jgi:hypothetical protein